MIESDILSFRAPAWSEDARRVLAALGDRWSGDVTVAIRRGALPFVATPDWPSGIQAIETVFALKRRTHLFRSDPSVTWAKFTEPQLTKGFAHFLNSPEPVVRIERIRALLSALGAPQLGNGIDHQVKATAEALTSKNKRIDLLIEWRDSSGRPCAAAIEAKLDHHITSGSLSTYRNHLRKIAKDRLLVVVAPRLTAKTERSLWRNRDWRWITWRDLLIAYERALPVDFDDAEYLRFRRTLWDQTG